MTIRQLKKVIINTDINKKSYILLKKIANKPKKNIPE